eukprot:1180999-Prorocentrum_minimum.AAC.4
MARMHSTPQSDLFIFILLVSVSAPGTPRSRTRKAETDPENLKPNPNNSQQPQWGALRRSDSLGDWHEHYYGPGWSVACTRRYWHRRTRKKQSVSIILDNRFGG